MLKMGFCSALDADMSVSDTTWYTAVFGTGFPFQNIAQCVLNIV